jgi:cytochrome c556
MLAVALAFSAHLIAANEKPTDAMKAVMNANAAANAAVREAQKANNFDAALATVATYKANYAYIEAFFNHKKLPAAAAMAANGSKAALELEAAATKKDAAALEKAVAGVTGTCGGCHKQFREQLADKSYEIKLP